MTPSSRIGGEPFDLILLVVLGDLIQQGVTQSDYSITGMTLAVGTIALMTVLISYLSFRFRRLRPAPRRRANRDAPGRQSARAQPQTGATDRGRTGYGSPTEPDFLVVEKIGEAREKIDHDHPQTHHHG